MTEIIVSSGQTSSGLSLSNGDTMRVLSGGTALNTSVLIDSLQFVSSGGVAISTGVFLGGAEYVYSGGVTDNTVATRGGVLVLQGGAASGSVMSAISIMVVDSGSVSVDATLIGQAHRNADEYVQLGGVASGTVVSSGGIEEVRSGAVASGTVVSSGGRQFVSGGVASGSVVGSGGLQIISSGVATSTTISAGGAQVVSGGAASSTKVDEGGAEGVHTGGGGGDHESLSLVGLSERIGPPQANPALVAITAASARLRAPILRKTPRKCSLIVTSARSSSRPISLFDSPRATPRSTSRSRWVRRSCQPIAVPGAASSSRRLAGTLVPPASSICSACAR